MVAYYVLTNTALAILGFLIFFGIWKLAEKGIFFCFIKEGQGAIFEQGESFSHIAISMHGHRCVLKDGRWEIEPGEPDYPLGVLGLLQKKFGIYWIGVYPFSRRMERKFRWNEWKQEEKDGVLVNRLWRREDDTKFFYTQTFPYALILRGAECGGTLTKDGKEIGGNVSVDLEITLLLRIVYPQVAILLNENWFDQLSVVVLDHIRLYVGAHPFEKLRTQEEPKSASNEPIEEGVVQTHNEFSEYVMKLNEHAPVGETAESVVDVFGIKIIGAHITSVDLSGESKKLAEATTAIYTAQQMAEATRIKADADAYTITQEGNARAGAAEAMIDVVERHGDVGRFVARQEAVKTAGQGNGSTIIFTGDREPGGLNEQTFAGLLLNNHERSAKCNSK